jgi:hypothetical protein
MWLLPMMAYTYTIFRGLLLALLTIASACIVAIPDAVIIYNSLYGLYGYYSYYSYYP